MQPYRHKLIWWRKQHALLFPHSLRCYIWITPYCVWINLLKDSISKLTPFEEPSLLQLIRLSSISVHIYLYKVHRVMRFNGVCYPIGNMFYSLEMFLKWMNMFFVTWNMIFSKVKVLSNITPWSLTVWMKKQCIGLDPNCIIKAWLYGFLLVLSKFNKKTTAHAIFKTVMRLF